MEKKPTTVIGQKRAMADNGTITIVNNKESLNVETNRKIIIY